MRADEKMKPMVCKIYGYGKGGIDIPDRRMQSYTTKSKTRKWTRVSNYYLLDKGRVNAQTIKVKQCLCLALVKPFKEVRLKVGGLTAKVERSIHEKLRKQVCKPATIDTPTKSRFACCVDSLAKSTMTILESMIQVALFVIKLFVQNIL